jgi:glycosyltransferase involved in cell wall biosynthesis
MRIAQVAPLYESVPPKLYGGTERVVSYLTEALVRAGHDVTLFASGDSVTNAELDSAWPCALRLDPTCDDYQTPHLLQLERVLQRSAEFDLIHFHVEGCHFPSLRRLATPHVTTLHGRLDRAALGPLFAEFDDIPVVSISDAQRVPIPHARWCGTVYHGLPENALRYSAGPGEYFAFLGRISPEKRVDRAIEIATRLNVPLKIAAKVDRVDQEYFKTEIEPLLDNPIVEFIGEINEQQKSDFLGGARALLFPIDWPEPFGLVMIEAMACGTPVVAMKGGSVPEIIDHGVTGFCVDTLDAAVDAATRVASIDRAGCRAAFEQRFSAARMASDYIEVYRTLVERGIPYSHVRLGDEQAATVAAE